MTQKWSPVRHSSDFHCCHKEQGGNRQGVQAAGLSSDAHCPQQWREAQGKRLRHTRAGPGITSLPEKPQLTTAVGTQVSTRSCDKPSLHSLSTVLISPSRYFQPLDTQTGHQIPFGPIVSSASILKMTGSTGTQQHVLSGQSLYKYRGRKESCILDTLVSYPRKKQTCQNLQAFRALAGLFLTPAVTMQQDRAWRRRF